MTTPIDDRLFSSTEPLVLAGSRCTECGTTTFPPQADCPRCARRTMATVTLPVTGELWTWTIQSFEPKPPYVAPADGFEPYPVGYVDLGDVMVETRLDADPADLAVGTTMRLVPWEVSSPDGGSMLGYAFAVEGTRP